MDEARETAIRLLARREHSRRELAAKLVARGFGDAVVAEVLDALEAEGLLSDARFVESYLHSRREKGYGPLRRRAELRERGVDEALIEAGLAALDADWASLCERAWRKRFGGQPPRDLRERARQQRFLCQRGFVREHFRTILEGE